MTPLPSEERNGSKSRTYDRYKSVVFLKTKERWGGLSNMSGEFPLRVNDVRIRTSEALYQACRFPHMPDVQKLIISQNSPMTAKMRSKPYRKDSRSDWDDVRVRIMRWCLRVKLAQNWKAFGNLLLASRDKPIVEQSRKDAFWGAKPVDDETLVGMNVLGRLLMELREELKSENAEALRFIQPLSITNFMLFGRPIELIEASSGAAPSTTEERLPDRHELSLFDYGECETLPSSLSDVEPFVLPDLAALPDNEWVTPMGTTNKNLNMFALIDAMRMAGNQSNSSNISMIATLACKPAMAVAFMDKAQKADWLRLIGQEAQPLPDNVVSLAKYQQAAADHDWGSVVRLHKESGALIESDDGTWSMGSKFPVSSGMPWMQGRMAIINELLSSISSAEAEQNIVTFIRSVVNGASARSVS